MAWAVVVAVLSAVFGYLGAVVLNTSVAGMMAVAAGGLFALAVLFAPRHGVLSKLAPQPGSGPAHRPRGPARPMLYRVEEAGTASGVRPGPAAL